MSLPILSLLLWSPALCALLVMLCSRFSAITAQWVGLLGSVAIFALSMVLYVDFDITTAQMQFVEKIAWIPAFNIHYYLGVDGISLPLILLSTFITILSIASSWRSVKKNLPQYIALFLLLESFILGVFMALDAILYYVFWEALLIPMFLIIGIWGGERRVYASVKFFLFTFFGSIFMLVAFIYMYYIGGSFEIIDMHLLPLEFTEQGWIFWAFFLAFAVKIPMVPVHTWLPDAHVEAPTAGSVILAAILLKMGGYGFIRFSLPIVPDAAAYFDWVVVLLSLIAVVYIGFIALVQKDMKKIIAYSSISHMGFVTLGFFVIYAMPLNVSASVLALEGGVVQMISHGFISAALFLCIGVLYDRMHSRNIDDYGGVATVMPAFGFFAVLFAMSNSGLPGTSGFVGEFMVILAALQANVWWALIAGLTLIIGAAYTLWMVKRVFYGKPIAEKVLTLQDLHWIEKSVFIALAFCIVLFGFWPDPLVDVMHASIANLFELATSTKISN
jgi:NADH-quinone oxidoreductase subunit M